MLTVSGSARHVVRRVRNSGRAPEADLGDLLAARRLREAVYSLTASVLAGETLADEALSEVNRQAAGLPVGVRLDRDGSRHRVGTVSQAPTLLARETVETLGGPEGDLLRGCARPECPDLPGPLPRAPAGMVCHGNLRQPRQGGGLPSPPTRRDDLTEGRDRGPPAATASIHS